MPEYIKPERYQLTIKPDLAGFVFEGEETITLTLGESTREITLHAKELEIESVSFKPSPRPSPRGGGGKTVLPKNIKYDEKAETATFSFNKNLSKGKGELGLKFKGILNDKMRGFYRSKYNHRGKEKFMATTQFEATDARMAFPCFDEPSSKAVFDITLMVPNGLIAISNTLPIQNNPSLTLPSGGEGISQEHQSGYKVVKFQPTPKMSTYLVAFIVGDFEFIEGYAKPAKIADKSARYNKDTLVRVFVTPGKKHQAKFALETAIKCLEFYNKYFDIPYPLPVLDLIAIPDFSHGAMENWGAVTYRESALLVDPENSSASNRQWVALVIAHELAHQWFGNLVTMEWWTHLWLNEGFASYIEYLAVDHIYPKWDVWTQFAFNDLGVALKLDSLKNTHPIEIEVRHPNEIGEIFDDISYSKGASVIRMLAGFLGEKDFREGLRYYLKRHSYANAHTGDLWAAFEKVSGKPVKKMMQNWTGKPGYPVLRVVEEKDKLILKQARFFSSEVSKKESKDGTVWSNPIKIENLKGHARDSLMTGRTLSLTLPQRGKVTAHWTKLNFGETGFYRVDYPAQMLNALKAPIKSKKLSAIDRLAIIRDAFALAEAGQLPTAQALNLLPAYENETDYTVWVELVNGLASLRNLLHNQDCYANFEQFCQKVLAKIGGEAGWAAKKGEAHTQGLLRSLILHQLAVFNHQPTLKRGLDLAKKSGKIPVDIRSVVYQIIAKQGGQKQHQNFIKRYKAENLSEEQGRIGRALGQFNSPSLLKKTLKFALSKEVRIQDTAQIFASVWNNPAGKKLAWQFIKNNWPLLLKRYPASGHILNRFIRPAAGFVSAADAKDFSEFFKKHKAPGAERAILQVLEKIYSNDAWLTRDLKHIEIWLEKTINQ